VADLLVPQNQAYIFAVSHDKLTIYDYAFRGDAEGNHDK